MVGTVQCSHHRSSAVRADAVHEDRPSVRSQSLDGAHRVHEYEVEVRILVALGAVDQPYLDVRYIRSDVVIGQAAERHYGVEVGRPLAEHADAAQENVIVLVGTCDGSSSSAWG